MATLDERCALVTGAGSGVGRGIALALAAEGASVALLGRRPEPLRQVAEEIRAQGGHAITVPFDVADLDAVAETVARVAADLGGIDILINNAWSGALGPLLTTEQHAFEAGFQTGPFATFAFMKACHPWLAKSGDGNVVNLVSSTMVRWDSSGFGSYAAAKAAIRMLTRTAAAEWGSDGIRVNCIAPLALSPGLESWFESAPAEAVTFVSTVPLGRIGDCQEDIGRAVAWIVGPAARYLSGATVPLDGGQAHF